jgi:hypothetical protein
VRKLDFKFLFAVCLTFLSPVSWGLYHVSNRDSFLFGGCIYATVFFCPLSAISLGLQLKKRNDSKLRALWILVFINALFFITIVLLLFTGTVIDWLNHQLKRF